MHSRMNSELFRHMSRACVRLQNQQLLNIPEFHLLILDNSCKSSVLQSQEVSTVLELSLLWPCRFLVGSRYFEYDYCFSDKSSINR